MSTVLLWIGLFAATALTDWLSAKWIDSASLSRRANISAIHEAVGILSGFTIYAWQHDALMIIPCVAGAWVGSYLAGIEEPIDPALLTAIEDAVILALDQRDTKV